jgi:hypothetical protein
MGNVRCARIFFAVCEFLSAVQGQRTGFAAAAAGLAVLLLVAGAAASTLVFLT